MKKFLALFAALLLAAPAYPWGKEGHQAIALVAEQSLTPNARRHIEKILGNDDLVSIAVWMDELRAASMHQGPLAEDPLAHSINRRFPKNGEWHYVDLPLGSDGYTDKGPFARPDDVVHMINRAVKVLEGESTEFSPQEAMLMVVHFVGDEHQPLHVACGYYDLSPGAARLLITDPAQAAGKPDDRGANALYYGPGPMDELHVYWDDKLVEKVAGSPNYRKLAALLQARIAAAHWQTPGDPHQWAEAWASESVEAARIAYAGIEFGAVRPGRQGGLRSIQITLPADYDAKAIPLAEKRLAQGGRHLAELLNTLHWKD